MIKIQDNLNTITPEQQKLLIDKALAYPFDIFVTIGAKGSKADFQAEVTSHVKAKSISIGIDPSHRFTFVRGSRDLGLPDGPEVSSAGGSYFRRADLVGGIDAIAAKAKELSVSSRVVESAAGAPIIVQEKPMASGWWWALGGVGAVVLGVSVWMWLSKRSREKQREEEAAAHRAAMAELNNEIGDAKIARAESGGYVPGDVIRPPVNDQAEFDRRLAASTARRQPTFASQAPDPVPQTVVVQQQQPDLLTTMLVYDALTDNHHHHHDTVVHERVVEHDSGGSSSGWGSSSSDSSSSSSWSSSSDSSSSSSWDSGSSSYDSGSSSSGSDW